MLMTLMKLMKLNKVMKLSAKLFGKTVCKKCLVKLSVKPLVGPSVVLFGDALRKAVRLGCLYKAVGKAVREAVW